MNDHSDPDLVQGLCTRPATLSPKYFYDRLGSVLFTAICELPEYYPTRVEAEIFGAHASGIAQLLPRPFTLVDLGAGDCRKAAGLLSVLQPNRYVAVDISEDFLQGSVEALANEHPDVQAHALARDFTKPWSLPAEFLDQAIVFFYPGSSIGNFAPDQAQDFMARLSAMGHGDNEVALFIGVDLVKDVAVLEAAYDDELGVTASFNRNALRHVNRILGSDFKLENWRHRAVYNSRDQRIEMHLVSNCEQVVRWPGGETRFSAGDTIHSESSYKYTPDGFVSLLDRAGFSVRASHTDAASQFLVVLAQSSRD